MISKKGLVILIAVAVVLVLVSVKFAVSSSDSVEISTEKGPQADSGAGKVGVEIIAPEIEDKLSGEGNE